MDVDFNPIRNYSYSELRDMSSVRLETLLSTFHLLRVPVTPKERVLLYFRKFPTESLDAKKPKKNIPGMLDFNKTPVPTNNKISLANSKQITYKNPFDTPKVSEKERFDATSKKIKENFPDHRTLLVVNFDVEQTEEFLKSVFNVFGDIRRVFGHNLESKFSIKTSKKVFFNVLIFKDRPSLLHCFDTIQFQELLFNKFMASFRKMSELEKAEIFERYMSSLGSDLKVNEFDN